ncbi:uncharacterized protein LOC141821571 [Curcuma longa]|uniref:uncharacterized protein LOC141821571 n=1 Tax=Curcuma longa TaxID=136217 RepID=UPI003D9E1D5D
MEKNECSESCVPRREKQQISVPFLWEEKPGRLKKDWSIETAPMAMALLPSPAKLVVSVPLLQPDHYMNPFVDEKNKNPYLNPFEVEEGEAVASDLEAFTFGLSDEVPGMEATRSFDIRAAAWESFSEDGSYWNEYFHTASETDDHSSSSGTEAEIGKDTSTVKYLFPVSLPDTSFLNNHGKDHTPSSETACLEPFQLNKFDHEHTANAKTFTLGELMMLCRKSSYRRKQTDVRMEHSKSMLICFPFFRNSNKTRAYIRSW